MLPTISNTHRSVPLRQTPKTFSLFDVLYARSRFRLRNGADTAIRTYSRDFARGRQRHISFANPDGICNGDERKRPHRPRRALSHALSLWMPNSCHVQGPIFDARA